MSNSFDPRNSQFEIRSAWRKELHRDFERALADTRLPERPDYEAANRFLVKARREMAGFNPL
jgi:hypothetical protein